MRVTCPTRTPATSVMASCGPAVIRPMVIPNSRACIETLPYESLRFPTPDGITATFTTYAIHASASNRWDLRNVSSSGVPSVKASSHTIPPLPPIVTVADYTTIVTGGQSNDPTKWAESACTQHIHLTRVFGVKGVPWRKTERPGAFPVEACRATHFGTWGIPRWAFKQSS